jgi:tRNA threonylcarbamoyladenosine biosynthesis protein TsaE
MTAFSYRADGLAQTDALAAALADCLPAGSVVALDGPLGAGKTRLVQGIAAALGVPPGTATSPTFVLVNEYAGRMPVYHFDAYRVKDEDEFLELGPDEYFEGRGLSLIEWADRVRRCLPRERLDVRVEVAGPDVRVFHVSAVGCYDAVVERLRHHPLLRDPEGPSMRDTSQTAPPAAAPLPQATHRTLDTPHGQAIGAAYCWPGGQYCAIHTHRGLVGCGIYDVHVAGEFGMAVAIAKGTPQRPLREPEDLYEAKIVAVSDPAARMGIQPGMTGMQALARLLGPDG